MVFNQGCTLESPGEFKTKQTSNVWEPPRFWYLLNHSRSLCSAKVENHCYRLIVSCIVTEYTIPRRFSEAMKNGSIVFCFSELPTFVWLINLSAPYECYTYMAVLSNAYAIFLNKHVLIKIQFSVLTMFYQMASMSLKLTSIVLGDLKERPGKFQDYLTGVLCVIGAA